MQISLIDIYPFVLNILMKQTRQQMAIDNTKVMIDPLSFIAGHQFTCAP